MYTIIPLTTAPNQTFNIVLPIDGNNLSLGFSVYWNDQGPCWLMDVTDNRINQQVLTAIPLLESVNNSQNLISQYAYLAIGSAFLANVSNTPFPPDDTNIGTDYLLIWNNSPSYTGA